MNMRTLFSVVLLTVSIGCSEEKSTDMPASAAQEEKPVQAPAPETNLTPSPSSTISVQEMLVSGPTQIKMHSLAMISQNIVNEIDESYLPGLKACAEDPNDPLRIISAELLGKHFVQGKEKPNPEAVALLIKLAADQSSHVRYNAAYHGLCQIKPKSDEILSLLIDLASRDKEQNLSETIAESVKPDVERVIELLDGKLKEGNNVAAYEVYEELTGKEPPYSDKYSNVPSSLPRLFVFKSTEADLGTFQADLEKALKAAGIEQPGLSASGSENNQVILLKTYLTKDRLIVEKEFSNHPELAFMQSMWLTPQLENQLKSVE
ncbi:MAG: HEAT repeat domain-containing protein [Pontiellaceae bacterium]|nr:HEAT repeat domain-containing protein [Pontiellaceae bacterium]